MIAWNDTTDENENDLVPVNCGSDANGSDSQSEKQLKQRISRLDGTATD
jgi:hypothetical protein